MDFCAVRNYISFGTTPDKAFQNAQEEIRSCSGFYGPSSPITSARGCKVIDYPPGADPYVWSADFLNSRQGQDILGSGRLLCVPLRGSYATRAIAQFPLLWSLEGNPYLLVSRSHNRIAV